MFLESTIVTLPVTAAADLLSALDLIWTKIGGRFQWEEGPDRLEIDERPSVALRLDQEVRMVVSLEGLEELVGWAEEHDRAEFRALLSLFRQAEAEIAAQGYSDAGV